MRENGFTLVELLVAITVMALLASAVVLTMPSSSGGADRAVSQFAARAAAARDQAILSGRPIGLWVTPSGYGFESLQGGAWQPLTQKPLQQTNWGGEVQAAVGAGAGRVRFDPTGLPDRPLDVTVAEGGRSATVRITASGDVVVP